MVASRSANEFKVAGMRKPVQASKTYKMQISSNDPRKAMSGEKIKRIAMEKIKQFQLTFRPNKIFVLKE